MNFPTCYRCTYEHGCEIKEQKREAIKGLGFTTAKFRCTKKKFYFDPGVQVTFEGWDGDGSQDEGRGLLSTYIGYFWKWQDRKIVVVSDETRSPIVKLWPNAATPTTEPPKRCCIHCGKPEGLADIIKPRDEDKPRPYVCRSDYGEYSQADHPCEFEGQV